MAVVLFVFFFIFLLVLWLVISLQKNLFLEGYVTSQTANEYFVHQGRTDIILETFTA